MLAGRQPFGSDQSMGRHERSQSTFYQPAEAIHPVVKAADNDIGCEDGIHGRRAQR